MRDENTKKQPSAQALSDDDLENVGGGWGRSGSDRDEYTLNSDEIKLLEDYGYGVEENPRYPGSYTVYIYKKGNAYKVPTYKDIKNILGPRS